MGITDWFRRRVARPAPNVEAELVERIGGYGAFTQGDPRDPADPTLSLLQLDTDAHIAWGDSGVGHWFIREADLRARDFSRVEYYWDCG